MSSRWPLESVSWRRAAESELRGSTTEEDEAPLWRLEPEPVGVEFTWLLETLGVLGDDALLKLELLDDEPLEKLGAELLCVVLEEDEALDELLDELLLLVVEECWAESTVGTSTRVTVRINRRMGYLLLLNLINAVWLGCASRLHQGYSPH